MTPQSARCMAVPYLLYKFINIQRVKYFTGADVSESDKEVRVNGVILTTRGLGNHGDKKLKKCILVEPYTTCVPIDQYAQFLVLATQGVWEVFSKQEAASLLLRVSHI